MQRIRGNQSVAFVIIDFHRRREHLVDAGAVLRPLQINHMGREVIRSVSRNVVVIVSLEIRPRSPALAGVLRSLRLYRGMVVSGASPLEKCAGAGGEPQRAENCTHVPVQSSGETALSNHERYVCWNPVLPPDV